jgi:hypothetical protein
MGFVSMAADCHEIGELIESVLILKCPFHFAKQVCGGPTQLCGDNHL